MFTGLVETVGVVAGAQRVRGGMRIEIYAPDFGRDMAIGDSVAVDGVCLTIVGFLRGAFTADVSEETLAKSTLGTVRAGSRVNLERALRLSDRLGGHLVSGHVDGVGTLIQRHPAGNSTIYQFRVPSELVRYLAPKASIALDGISLTVAQAKDDSVAVAVIPHTEASTTLGEKTIGSGVNVEIDMLARYVERFVAPHAQGSPDRPRPTRPSDGLWRDLLEGK